MNSRTFKGSKFFCPVINAKGVSLVEALLALGLISVVALSSLTFFSEVSKISHRSRETCRIYNLSFLERIRSYGVVNSVANFVPMPGLTTQTAPFPFSYPIQVTDAARWPAEPILGGTPPSPAAFEEALFNSSLLIDGYMNILQAIYNANPGICSNFVQIGNTDVTVPNSLMLKYPEGFKDPTTNAGMKIKIVPYDVDTGALKTCADVGNTVRLAPRGRHLKTNEGDSPFIGVTGDKKMLTKPAEYRTDIGFAVQVQTEFINEQQDVDSCFTASKFQYHIDTNPPPEPKVLNLVMTTGVPLGVCTPASTNELYLEVGYDATVPGDSIEPGSVLLCQDLSVMPTLGRIIGGVQSQSIACKLLDDSSGPAPPGPQMSPYLPLSGYIPAAGTSAFDYTGLGSIVPPKWVPCHELTLCGVQPKTVANTSVGNTKITYRLDYENLPSDCRAIVKVAGVDTAANPSVVHASPSLADFTSNNPAINAPWDIPRPRCRNYCPTGPWPSGYFTCSTLC